MADAGGDWGVAAHWYPEIVAVGDASCAWQAEFDRLGMPLQARPREANPRRAATVENGELYADCC